MIHLAFSLYYLILPAVFHPFHISVTDIEFDQEAKSIEISQKIFIDDLEEVLRNRGKESIDIIDESQKEANDLLIKNYLAEHFSVQANGKSVQYNFLGTLVEEDAIWCFMEIPKTRRLKKIAVRNTLLTELFEDQMNLVHVKRDGKIKSMRLHRANPQESFDYQ